ncbi:MAG: acyltransferase domain-containing protein [Candidatus Eisenbacteria bacterium]
MPGSRPRHAPHRAEETALLYPTGGYHWPGMGADVERCPYREVFDRAEATLAPFGVAPGSLRRLMAGEGQARRDRVTPAAAAGAGTASASRWLWTGDFPLSMVAQMALGVALSRAFLDHHGPPCLLAGESMGELAAYCVAGALSIEESAALTYRWAHDLATASDRIGLRMAVVEDVDEGSWNTFAPALEANIVVSDAPHLFVAALPPHRLDELDREVAARGGRTLVSNNPCAAHEPRLARERDIWDAHKRYLEARTFAVPSIPLLSTLHPGEQLDSAEALLRNRIDTTFHRVRWMKTLLQLPALGVRQIVQFGPSSSGYPLKKLRGERPELAHLKLRLVADIEGARRAAAR